MSVQLDFFDQLSAYEGADVEYKSARGGLPGSVWETYSAFANTDGGTILLGVSQKDDHLEFHGVDDPDKLRSDFWSSVNNRGKVSLNLLSEQDVQEVPFGDHPRPLLVIRVPRADRRQRPVYIGPNPLEGTYRRNHDGDYRCTPDEVRRMFAAQGDAPLDQRLLPGLTMADLDAESIRQYRNRFGSRAPDHPWLAEDDATLLVKLGALRVDRSTGLVSVTVAGLLMFGRTDVLGSADGMPGFHLDYRERLSDDPNIRWTDRVTVDGTWEANLFQFYQRVILKLGTGPGLKAPFLLDAEGYRQAGSDVHEALQEALVNALIHGDHAGQGGVVIDRYVDKIEFSNPGTLLVSREQLLQGGVSECRNKALQRMFQMLGVGDKAGSGIDRIRRSWDAQHWRSPRLRETHRPDRVELILPMVSTLPIEALDGLAKRFGDVLSALGPDEVQTLVTAAVEGDVTNQRLQETVARHRVDITRMLRGLVQQGFLVAHGSGRGTRYRVPGVSYSDVTLGQGPSSEAVDSQGSAAANSQGSAANSQGSAANSQGSAASSQGSAASSQGSARAGQLDGQEIPVLTGAADDPGLQVLAGVIRTRKRAPAARVRGVILLLCTQRFLSLQDLAVLLQRHAEHLRTVYLRPMVAEGLLVLRFPAQPNHPAQQYRAADRSREGEMASPR